MNFIDGTEGRWIPLYYIGTGNTFITTDKNGKAIPTMNFADVKTFNTKQKASQFLVSLPRKLYELSSKWEVKEYHSSNTNKSQSNKNLQTQTKSDKTDKTLDVLYDQPDKDHQQVDYLKLLDSVSILKESKKGCLTDLNSKLSDIDQEIVDLEHYIEFSKLNACEACNAYKMLRETLQKRRKIKDNIIAAQTLYESCDIDTLSSCSNHLHNRIYYPRKLKSLFQ